MAKVLQQSELIVWDEWNGTQKIFGNIRPHIARTKTGLVVQSFYWQVIFAKHYQ
jgi:hypothetical protein